MTKGDGLNPGVEFFYKLSRKPEFQRDLVKARKQLCINEKGFFDPKTREKLWIENKCADTLTLLGIELHFKQKYNVPVPYWQFIDDYIFFGKPVHALKNNAPVAMIASYSPSGFESIEKFYDANNEPYVKLFIFENATKTKVIDFIKKNWRDIELGLNINIHKRKRVRKTIYKERNQTISELCRKSMQELRKEFGVDSKYKDSLIAKILEKKNYGKVSEGYIRKICSQK